MAIAGERWVSGADDGVADERDLLSPATFLMKICMVETGSGDDDREVDAECIVSVMVDYSNKRTSNEESLGCTRCLVTKQIRAVIAL
jgi:hypothetical protein